jgi:signal transduction histidine kinase/ActR/RegA family two-component response regulator
MLGLTKLSVKWLLRLITLVVALPAAGVIVQSGLRARDAKLEEARKESRTLADRIVSEQQVLVAGSQQMMTVLAQLPEVKARNTAKVEPILRELHKSNPLYNNIFIADLEGKVWASAVPAKLPFSVHDRRYFKNAKEGGQFSSGEYVLSRSTGRPVLNFAYPLRNDRGTVTGVVSVAFGMDRYQRLLEQMQLPRGTSFVLADYKGVILYRAINPETYIGKPYPPEEFRKMSEGPESGTSARLGLAGDKRMVSYRKMRLAGEMTPYMYVTAGIPMATAVQEANRALAVNVALLAACLLLAYCVATLLGKKAILDRILLLEDASRRLAAGDLETRVSDHVAGGELGRLGQTFDDMAAELAKREAERLQAALERDLVTDQLIQAQKMESVGRLAGGVAHDFNNLLTPILVYADLLAVNLSGDQAGLTKLENIRKAADRARLLVQQLLSFSRKHVMEMKTLDLNQTISELHGILRHTVLESITLRLGLAPECGCIRADRNQIEQVIMNLAVNAQDAIGKHGVITIETAPVVFDAEYARRHSEVVPGRYVMLAVSDDGCGMDRETQKRIFEPFFTTKEVGKGTGLGLATVYGIVRQHGAHVWVYSEPGRGTIFKCYFPVVDGLPEQEGPATDEQVRPVGGGQTVLLVEDDEMVRTPVFELLMRHGAEVLVAEDPKRALEIAQGRRLDLLITDVIMPGMTGVDLRIRLLEHSPGLRTLYMSGYTSSVITDQMVLESGAHFIEKPFAVHQFEKKLEALLTSEVDTGEGGEGNCPGGEGGTPIRRENAEPASEA